MPRKLLAFLEEKQEPFALKVYLLERGYIRNSFNSEHSFPCCSSKNYTKNFNKLSGSTLHKKRKCVPNCPKVVKTILSKIVSFKSPNKPNKSHNGDQNVSVIVSDSFTASDAEYTTNGTTYIADSSHVLKNVDKELARRDVEDSNQLSPVSVLELQETQCDDSKPLLNRRNYAKRNQESSSLAIGSPKFENPFEFNAKGMQEVISSQFFAHYKKNKKAVLHSNQLMLDCVRETVEDQRRKGRNASQQFERILGSEELWKHICENIWLWSKDNIDETNFEHLLHFDLLASMEEWSNYEERRSEIGEVIVDAIFDDIINQIIVSLW